MARIAGIQIEKDVKGRPAYARINLKKYPETMELLARIGAIKSEDFDAEFAKGISGEELITRVCSDLEKVMPKRNG